VIKHILRPDQQRLAREDMALHPVTPEDREALVGAAKSYTEWQAAEDRRLLVQIIQALKSNPKLAAEIKIILRGDKP
jgi:hypothetical protein